jgi:hypothetical protein
MEAIVPGLLDPVRRGFAGIGHVSCLRAMLEVTLT